MKISFYHDINTILKEILVQTKNILGGKFIGLYLYGSMATGDFDYNKSDIDLLVICFNTIDEIEFSKLNNMHNELALHFTHAREDRLEIAYISLDSLQHIKSGKSKIAMISPGEPFHFKIPGNDWILNLFLIQEKGVVLSGPLPKSIFPHIGKEEFREAIKKQVYEWSECIAIIKSSRGYQAYVVITLCRALYTYIYGEPVSKKQAGLWAEKELPHWSTLIHDSLTWQKTSNNDRLDCQKNYLHIREFVDDILHRISII